jgi:hypothetical protein
MYKMISGHALYQDFLIRRVWRYQRGNKNQYIEEGQTTQWPKEKVQKDKQRSTKHTHKLHKHYLSNWRNHKLIELKMVNVSSQTLLIRKSWYKACPDIILYIFTASVYLFGIFKLFFLKAQTNHVIYHMFHDIVTQNIKQVQKCHCTYCFWSISPLKLVTYKSSV